MKFKENDIVRTTKNCDDIIKVGDVGVVIMVFEKPTEGYEVEFVDANGYFKAQYTFLPDEIELI